MERSPIRINDIIEMMSDSTKEMERVSRVVGKEGRLSQRAMLPASSRFMEEQGQCGEPSDR